jgi:CRISPR/Cas system CMR-associated protein Cmr5 small subunit
MAPPASQDNGTDMFRDKLKDHDTLIEIKTTVIQIKEKLDCMEKKVIYKDACEATESGAAQRMDHIEGDIKEIKDNNNNRTTLIMAGIAIIVAVVVPVVAAVIQYVH